MGDGNRKVPVPRLVDRSCVRSLLESMEGDLSGHCQGFRPPEHYGRQDGRPGIDNLSRPSVDVL